MAGQNIMVNLDLHSTIFRFVLLTVQVWFLVLLDLHSTIFRFVHGRLIEFDLVLDIYIPLFLDLY